LSWVEVALRNVTHANLMAYAKAAGTSRWDTTDEPWFNPWFQAESVRQIRRARARANDARSALGPPTGKVVADLTFGFWVRLYSRHYEAGLWTPTLRHGFPGGLARKTVHNQLLVLNRLRNRAAHHEAIFDGPHAEWMSTIGEVLAWLSPALAETVLSRSRLPASLLAMHRLLG
jgi:hypothetical protein